FLWQGTGFGASEQGRAERPRDECGSRQMSGRTVELSQRKQAAIIALVTQPTVAEAARVANVRPNTLGRWKKEPAFDAEWRGARCLGLHQAIARLQKISGAAVSALLKVMFDSASPPAAQLKAAETVLRYAKAAAELEHVQARLTELERSAAASKPEQLRVAAEERRRPQSKGHGEKFSRMKEAAIAALLTHRRVEEAARGIESERRLCMNGGSIRSLWKIGGRQNAPPFCRPTCACSRRRARRRQSSPGFWLVPPHHGQRGFGLPVCLCSTGCLLLRKTSRSGYWR